MAGVECETKAAAVPNDLGNKGEHKPPLKAHPGEGTSRAFGRDLGNILGQGQGLSQAVPKPNQAAGKSVLEGECPLSQLESTGPMAAGTGEAARPGLKPSPQDCEEYAEAIDGHMRTIETWHIPKAGYMAGQQDVNEKMRAILVDWLVDVHLKFKLVPDTLYLAVNLLDRYLEKESVVRQQLQLVGVAAMLIACKYEEIYPPENRDFVYISDNAYTKADILRMEQKMLKVLGFNINAPSSYKFLQRFRKLLNVNGRTSSMAQYLIELSLVEYKMLKYRPSHCAAAALYLSNRLLNKDLLWDSKVGERIGYKEIAIKSCAKELAVIMQAANKSCLQAVKKKFSLREHLEVAFIRIGRKC